MHKTLALIGTLANYIAYGIIAFTTWQVITVILFMPLVLLIILYSGDITIMKGDTNILKAMSSYAAWVITFIASWIIYGVNHALKKRREANKWKNKRNQEIFY